MLQAHTSVTGALPLAQVFSVCEQPRWLTPLCVCSCVSQSWCMRRLIWRSVWRSWSTAASSCLERLTPLVRLGSTAQARACSVPYLCGEQRVPKQLLELEPSTYQALHISYCCLTGLIHSRAGFPGSSCLVPHYRACTPILQTLLRLLLCSRGVHCTVPESKGYPQTAAPGERGVHQQAGSG